MQSMPNKIGNALYNMSSIRMTLPNIPFRAIKTLASDQLIPTYSGQKPIVMDEISSSITFEQLAEAIQNSEHEWLTQVLALYSNKLPLKDESTGINVLHIAAKVSSEPILIILLRNQNVLRFLNEVDSEGVTPLIAAAWYGNFEALRFFLALGCKTTGYIYESKKTALHCAAAITNSQLVIQLLKYNTNRTFIDAVDKNGNTALLIAVRIGSNCVFKLITAGANYKYQNLITGRNILHQAVLFFQNNLLEKLLNAFNDTKLISVVDFNGDNPFLLAVRLQNYTAVKIFINNISISKLLYNNENCLTYLIKHDYSDTLSVLIAAADDLRFLEWSDSKGRNPLMYAVETRRADNVTEILSRQKDLLYRNPLNGETVLHLAAYANDSEIMHKLLSINEVKDIIDCVDKSGRTAYEIILCKSNQPIYYIFKNSGFASAKFFNSLNESSLFIAAKSGNYDLVLNLLLSEAFLNFHQEFSEFTKLQLIRAELQGRIYSSDAFIICGEALNLHDWNRTPDQEYLFEHNINGQSIFHACVIGENLMCLTFIYNYCLNFNDYWKELDLADNEGTTPLLYASKSGKGNICKFLLQNGANITFKNLKYTYPLLEMLKNIPNFIELFTNIINECVIEDTARRRMEEISSGLISISYNMFCPDNVKQLHIMKIIFQVLKKDRIYYEILENPVIEYFIEIKWAMLKYMVKVRRHINAVTILYTYIYVILNIWWFTDNTNIASIFRWPALTLSTISVFIDAPLLFMTCVTWEGRVLSTVIVVSPIFTLLFVEMDSQQVLSLEVGSLAILSAGLSILIHSVDSPLDYQVSVFKQILSSILTHLPLGFLLIISFSLCFFIIFRNTFYFSNPFTSFLYTVMVLIEGDGSTFPTFEKQHFIFNSTNNSTRSSYFVQITLFLIEGLLLILFKLLVCLTLLNMLIGLSVRGASDLEQGGSILRLKNKVDILFEWETFSYSKFYNWISKHNLFFLFGLKRNLKESLVIPKTIYPHQLSRELKTFDLNRLQNIAVKKDEIPLPNIKYLSEQVGYREVQYPMSRESLFYS